MDNNSTFIHCKICNKKINKYYFKKHMQTKRHTPIDIKTNDTYLLKKKGNFILIFN